MNFEFIFLKVAEPGGKHLGSVLVKATGYRQVVSMSAFMHGGYRTEDTQDRRTWRTYDPHHQMIWIGRPEREYYDIYRKSDREAEERMPGLDLSNQHPEPTWTYDDPFAFYEAIGYDRKRHKFIKVNTKIPVNIIREG